MAPPRVSATPLARKRRLPLLRLETNKALTEAQALYKGCGYREVKPFNDEPYAQNWFEKAGIPLSGIRKGDYAGDTDVPFWWCELEQTTFSSKESTMAFVHWRQWLGCSALVMAALATSAPAGVLVAQDVMDAKAAGYLRDQYLADMDTVHRKITALANAIPAERYSWRPAQGVRTVSEVLMHVASEWFYYGPQSIGGKPPADFGAPNEALPKLEKAFTKKTQVLEQLDKGWAYFVAQMKAADVSKLTGRYQPWNSTLAEAAFGMTGDQHEHLGQLIAYARSVGVTPPWSK